MKYQLKDICSITKGATGIMKAIPGKYPLVALSDERRSHNEFQFDANAVIVPLISSTGHGHASMKRVHYQEGKFALGNILCALIPKDEKQLNAKYLHLYVQQFKETLLVPLMKGAANVSLPMNKLAEVEIDVPSLKRQLEINALEDKAAELKNELEEKLALQDGDVNKLRQAILREAMQGKLVKQNAKDGHAVDLINKIKARNGNELSQIKEKEIPFAIPENWIWCRFGEIGYLKRGKSKHRPRNDDRLFSNGTYPFIQTGDVSKAKSNQDLITTINGYYNDFGLKQSELQKHGTLCITIAANIAECGFLNFDACVPDSIVCFFSIDKTIEKYAYYYLKIAKDELERFAPATAQKNINLGILNHLVIPLPPLSEQYRIVKKLEQLMQLCDELQNRIQQSKIENEKLLQGALRDALKKEEVITT